MWSSKVGIYVWICCEHSTETCLPVLSSGNICISALNKIKVWEFWSWIYNDFGHFWEWKVKALQQLTSKFHKEFYSQFVFGNNFDKNINDSISTFRTNPGVKIITIATINLNNTVTMTMIMATSIYNHEKSIWPTVSTLYIDFMYKQLHAYSLHPQN